MAFLIAQLVVPLTIAAVFGGGLAGWSWHCVRMRDAWEARDRERDRLRNELLAYVGAADPAIQLGGSEYQALQLRADTASQQLAAAQRELVLRDDVVDAQRARIVDLETSLAAAQAQLGDDSVEHDPARLGALENALAVAEAQAADLARRAEDLQRALDGASGATPEVDVAALRWRVRELEAALARREADDGIAQLAPESAPEPEPQRRDLEDIILRQQWQTRYLNARVRYLEDLSPAPPPPAPPPAPVAAPAAPVDAEADNRRRWRQRYLEARVAWLEGRSRDNADARARLAGEVEERDRRIATLAASPPAAPADDGRVAALTQRVAELEGALAAARAETTHAGRRIADLEAGIVGRDARIALLQESAAAPVENRETASLRWRARYLDSRVRHLEQSLAQTPKVQPPPPAAPRDDTFAPIAPRGSEVRPDGLPAPRGGAPDDLRLIAGVSPRVESTLNALGVFHFDQIAAWTPANVEWLERYLAFKGRIAREQWVEKARRLAQDELAPA